MRKLRDVLFSFHPTDEEIYAQWDDAQTDSRDGFWDLVGLLTIALFVLAVCA